MSQLKAPQKYAIQDAQLAASRLFERQNGLVDELSAPGQRHEAKEIKKLAGKYNTAAKVLAEVQVKAIQTAAADYQLWLMYQGSRFNVNTLFLI